MELVKIERPEELDKAWAGAIVSVVIPNKWILHIHPDHPAWVDIFSEEIKAWPLDGLKMMNRDGMPAIVLEYVKVELERRKRK